jgi:hypothetical protein
VQRVALPKDALVEVDRGGLRSSVP